MFKSCNITKLVKVTLSNKNRNREGPQVNNSVTFSGKPIEREEFFNQMVEALGIIIDRRPKGRPHKMESQIIEKIGCSYLN